MKLENAKADLGKGRLAEDIKAVRAFDSLDINRSTIDWQDAALSAKLCREVAAYLARCKQRRWAESLPHASQLPTATGKGGRIQAWRADDPRDRFFEKPRAAA